MVESQVVLPHFGTASHTRLQLPLFFISETETATESMLLLIN